MKARTSLMTFAAITIAAVVATSCGKNEKGTVCKVDALDDSVWSQSEWIASAAPLVFPEENEDKAANGASWFLTTLKNEGKVVSAKWMA
ncbi:MAG: hypothetical protein J6N54_04500, partial [Bacteroidales bacterium]|nr:hypothetical protein [Bacteroidales bacterium]